MQEKNELSYYQLLLIRFKISFFNFIEEMRVCGRYYLKSARFCGIDFDLRLRYFFRSPFQVSKAYLREKGEDDLYVYGETPLTTMARIVDEVGIDEGDVVLELGSGRGRPLFWLAEFVGCQVRGIEQIPLFVERAQAVQRRWGAKRVSFEQGDFLESLFEGASVIFLYGITLSDEVVNVLAAKCGHLEKGTKVISVSFPLSEYEGAGKLSLEKTFTAAFPWGEATVYVDKVRD